jgi:hypothetical protein
MGLDRWHIVFISVELLIFIESYQYCKGVIVHFQTTLVLNNSIQVYTFSFAVCRFFDWIFCIWSKRARSKASFGSIPVFGSIQRELLNPSRPWARVGSILGSPRFELVATLGGAIFCNKKSSNVKHNEFIKIPNIILFGLNITGLASTWFNKRFEPT